MTAQARSGALTAGLILITLGIIFLIENFYTPFSVWRLVARYWPVILIIVGLKKLYSHFSWPAIPPAPGKIPPKE